MSEQIKNLSDLKTGFKGFYAHRHDAFTNGRMGPCRWPADDRCHNISDKIVGLKAVINVESNRETLGS